MYSTYKIHVSCMYGRTKYHAYTVVVLHTYTHSLAHIQLATDTTIHVGFHHHRDVVKQLHILKCRDHAGVILRPTSGERQAKKSQSSVLTNDSN